MCENGHPARLIAPGIHASRDDGQDVQVSRSTGMCESDCTSIHGRKKNPAVRRGEKRFSASEEPVLPCNETVSEVGPDRP